MSTVDSWWTHEGHKEDTPWLTQTKWQTRADKERTKPDIRWTYGRAGPEAWPKHIAPSLFFHKRELYQHRPQTVLKHEIAFALVLFTDQKKDVTENTASACNLHHQRPKERWFGRSAALHKNTARQNSINPRHR